jgi:hypothetical protein
MAVLPDGHRALAATRHELKLWELDGGDLRTLAENEDKVRAVAALPDGHRILKSR